MVPARLVLVAALLALLAACSRGSAPEDSPDTAGYIERERSGYGYHWATAAEWERQKAAGRYVLAGRDYIATSKTFEVLIGKANRHLADNAEPMVLLVIDETKVTAPIRYWHEPGMRPEEVAPSIYGVLNLDAVVKVVPFERDAAGRYVVPTALR